MSNGVVITDASGNVATITGGALNVASSGGGGGNVTITGPLGTGNQSVGVTVTLDNTDSTALATIATNTGNHTISQLPFSRYTVIEGAITLAAAYTTGQDVGGIINIPTALGASAPLVVDAIDITITTTGNMTAPPALLGMVTSGNLTGTYTDGNLVVISLADAAKRIYAVSWNIAIAVGTNVSIQTINPITSGRYGTADTGGNLNLALWVTGNTSYTGTASLTYRAQIRY